MIDDAGARVPLPGLAGFSCEGPPADALAALDPVFRLNCDAGASLTIARERLQGEPIALPEAALSADDGDFGGPAGFARRRQPAPGDVPQLLRYYDPERDYQPALQRATGRPRPGQPQGIDLPGAMAAGEARALIDAPARGAAWA